MAKLSQVESSSLHGSQLLIRSIEKENFRFYGQTLNGIEVQKPRWKRSIRALVNAMGDNLGQEYVKLFFGEKEKKRYSDMVENVRTTFSEHIAQLDWMTPEDQEESSREVKING
jgi:putative endopeptidase